jgi:SAM-dependent methyltransferase
MRMMTPHWTAASSYESYVGRWSRLVAERFVDWLAPRPGGRWLDVGCGTGALAAAIHDRADPCHVVSADISLPYLTHARSRLADPRVFHVCARAESPPVRRRSHDAAVSGLVLNFLTDPNAVLVELAAIVRVGGAVSAYVWDYNGRMEMMQATWEEATKLDPAVESHPARSGYTLCRPEALHRLFDSAKLQDVHVAPLDIGMRFEGFDDLWEPLLSGQGSLSGYVSSLASARQAELRAALQARFCTGRDGSAFTLAARAWAVRGTV